MVTRFFIPDWFPSVDVAWVSQHLRLAQGAIQLSEYTHNRTLYHRTIILTQLGYAVFDHAHRLELAREARRLTHLQTLIEQHLAPGDQAVSDALLDNTTTPERAGRYPLTHLKRISQSMPPKDITGRVALFQELKTLFIPVTPLIARLDLADETIQ